MTDKEIELLFKSIENFEVFLKHVEQRQNIMLSNGIEVKFNNELNNFTQIQLRNKVITLSDFTFLIIVKHLTTEKDIQEKNERTRKNKVEEERLRNEVFDLGQNKYKVHKVYIDSMYSASDIASAHGAYLQKLQRLLRIVNGDNVLFVDQKEIKTKHDLINFLSAYGFQHIEKDSRL